MHEYPYLTFKNDIEFNTILPWNFPLFFIQYHKNKSRYFSQGKLNKQLKYQGCDVGDITLKPEVFRRFKQICLIRKNTNIYYKCEMWSQKIQEWNISNSLLLVACLFLSSDHTHRLCIHDLPNQLWSNKSTL